MDGNLINTPYGIRYGVPLTRREDDRLVVGRGQYVDDVRQPEALYAVFVRSPHPNARILSIDASAAREMPGVVAVLTEAEVLADGVKECPNPWKTPGVYGEEPWVETRRPLLASEHARFVGEPVAMVLADKLTTAMDAAEAVMVDYETAPAVVDALAAKAADAPQVWEDRPGNVALRWRGGGVDQIDAALAASHHVTKLTSRITRVSAMSLEPRGALAYPDPDGRMTIRLSHQSPHQFLAILLSMFGMERQQVRVLAGEVGGSFGMKTGPTREEILVFWAARYLKRPVRWTETRSEAFFSDEHARDIWVHTELGLDKDGRFTALRVHYECAVGAYMTVRSTSPINNFGGIAGVYTTPVIVGEMTGYFTHTPQTVSYRGAGRPEATFTIERIIDLAAAELNIDPVDLRRRNLIPPSAMPYKTPFLFTYDCGEFERNVDMALSMIDYAGFEKRRAEARARGKLRGIGMANPIEVAGGPLGKKPTDWADVAVAPDGSVTLAVGNFSVGQGLETMLPVVAAQALGIGAERVRYVQGDTDAIADGKGNGGSSALILCGSAVCYAVDALLEQGRAVAAGMLGVAAESLTYANGAFRAAGSGATATLGDIANHLQSEKKSGFIGRGKFQALDPTYPNGCHICEVEIDPDTGVVKVVDYVSVEDVGRVLNPLLVEGQLHGGIAQGIGQALFEEIRFDADGQLITGSFMDYPMPRADDIPRIRSANPETPTKLNPLGVKGVGEAGTVGSIGATMNAVCNALLPAGIRHIDMPATPQRVWQALRDAGFKA